MTRSNASPRLTHLLAIVAAMLSLSVCAQPLPQDSGSDADPPSRVARMSYASGRVSFSPGGSDAWVEARVNRPIVTGDRLWADSDSRAEVAIDNSTWWLGDTTSIAVSNLDDRIVQMQVQEGVLEVRVRRVPADNIVEIDTPNLAFSITRPGRYRVEVDPQDGSTMVAVRDGSGDVYGEGGSYVITAGQAYRFYGTDVSDSEFVALPPVDAFTRFVQDRDRVYTSSASLRYVSPAVIGYEDLDRYGTWSVETTYGNVWFPRQVAADWAPYREGHWAWIDPWGWTWVDDEPWGFAPFHYGRWAHFGRGWGWVPGPRSARAVYAPALVAFVGGAGFGLSVSSGPAIGWFPLGPREVYVPPYRVSRNYFQRVNVTNTVVNVTNITNIYNNPTRVSQLNYVNRSAPNALTAVPPAAFAQSQSVRRAAVALPATAVQRAQVQAVAAVAPARPAFLGAAPAAQVRPPAATMQRQVVAKAPPPPPPVPDAQKVQALEKNPGRPLTRAEVQTLRRAAPPAAASAAAAPAPAKVVSPPKPAANAAPPAREAGTRRPGAAPKGPPGAAGPEAAPKGPPGVAAPEAAPKGPPGAAPEAAPKGPPGAVAPPPRGPTAPPSTVPRRNAPEAAPAERAAPPARSTPRTPPGAAERGARPETPGAAPESPGVARPPEARRPETGAVPGASRPPERPVPTPRAAPGRPEGGPPGLAPRPEERVPVTPRTPPQAAPPVRAAPEPQRPPEARAQPQRPPEARPEPQRPPEARAQPQRPPEARPQPQRPPEARPEPQRPPEARPQPQRPPEARPEPQRPPEARPQPQRPPEARPQPQPEAARRPEPPRGPPPQAARPAPEQRQPAQRPPPKDEKGKDKDKEGNG